MDSRNVKFDTTREGGSRTKEGGRPYRRKHRDSSFEFDVSYVYAYVYGIRTFCAHSVRYSPWTDSAGAIHMYVHVHPSTRQSILCYTYTSTYRYGHVTSVCMHRNSVRPKNGSRALARSRTQMHTQRTLADSPKKPLHPSFPSPSAS